MINKIVLLTHQELITLMLDAFRIALEEQKIEESKKGGKAPPKEPQKYGNAKVAGIRYGVHGNTIRAWATRGHIKKRSVGGVSLYSFDEIDAFLESRAE